MKHLLKISESIGHDTMYYTPTTISCICGKEIELDNDYEEETQEIFRSFINKHNDKEI